MGFRRASKGGFYISMKTQRPTKKEMKIWLKDQEQLAREFRLSVTDIHNLYDLFYMISPGGIQMDLQETLKLNKMDKWFYNLFERLDDICLNELKGGIKK